jgi:hypothetical protein
MAGCPQIECFTLEGAKKNDWLMSFRQMTGANYALKSGKGWATRESVNDIANIISDPKSMDPRVPESMDFSQKKILKKSKKGNNKIAVNGEKATFRGGKLYDVKMPEKKFMGNLPDYMKIFPEYNAPIYNLAEMIHRFEETFGLTHRFKTEEALKLFFDYYKGGLTDVEAMDEAKPLIDHLTHYFSVVSKAEKSRVVDTNNNLIIGDLHTDMLKGIANYVVLLDQTELTEVGGVIPSKGIQALIRMIPEGYSEVIDKQMKDYTFADFRQIKREKEERLLYSQPNVFDEYADRTGIINETANPIRIVPGMIDIFRNPQQHIYDQGEGFERIAVPTRIEENTGQGDRRDLRPAGGFPPDRTQAPSKVDEDPRR